MNDKNGGRLYWLPSAQVRDQAREWREEMKDLEVARLHEVIEVMRQFCEHALTQCMHPKSVQAMALNRAIEMANRAVPR
jgi:hypothetical protein